MFNCVNDGTVYSVAQHKNKGSSYAGGIVGEAIFATVSSCVNEGSVTASTTNTESGAPMTLYSGGIAARLSSAAALSCINFGAVTAKPEIAHTTAADLKVGGIAGHVGGSKPKINNSYVVMYATVHNCLSVGEVSNAATASVAATNTRCFMIANYIDNDFECCDVVL